MASPNVIECLWALVRREALGRKERPERGMEIPRQKRHRLAELEASLTVVIRTEAGTRIALSNIGEDSVGLRHCAGATDVKGWHHG